jgi:hypothetical protein
MQQASPWVDVKTIHGSNEARTITIIDTDCHAAGAGVFDVGK